MVAVFSMAGMNKPAASVTTGTEGLGVSLLELMVVLAIVAILAGLALPSFEGMVKRWQTRAAAENLVSAIYLARSEAARFGGIELVSRSEAGCPRITGQWQCGWQIQTIGEPRTVLRTAEAAKSLLITRSPAVNLMTFNQFAQLKGLGAYRFVVTHVADQGDGSKATTICVTSAGRVRVVASSNSCDG